MGYWAETIVPKGDQLNAEDVLASGPITIKITKVTVNRGKEQPAIVNFEGDNGRPFKPCKTVRKVMAAIWGKDESKFIGRSMTLYYDPDVTWAGQKYGGIRVSHMSHMDRERVLALSESRNKRKPVVIRPLVADEHETPAPPPTPDIDPEEAQNAQAEALAIAAQGMEAFTEWWNSDEGKAKRDLVMPILEELKAEVAKADAARESEQDPFGLPPV